MKMLNKLWKKVATVRGVALSTLLFIFATSQVLGVEILFKALIFFATLGFALLGLFIFFVFVWGGVFLWKEVTARLEDRPYD
jgi:hypothetical protein